jgi:PilZ domain
VLKSPRRRSVEESDEEEVAIMQHTLPLQTHEVLPVQAGTVPAAGHLRRSERVPKEVAILLVGCDAEGKDFMEETKTVVLSRHGAGIVSAYKLAAEQELVMVLTRCNREAEIRVVGKIGSEGNAYTYGVAFLDPGIDFWGDEFPVEAGAESSEHRKVLACSLCGRRQIRMLGVLESDVCAIHDGMLQYCSHCGSSTVWKLSSSEVPDEPAPQPMQPAQAEPAPSPEPFKNRRRHVRTKVNFSAIVRDRGSEDIAFCENVSRGGLCFRSSRSYTEKADVEIAAPYSPGSPCILVRAQIVHVEEVPGEKMFRYGVRYLPVTKNSPLQTLPSAVGESVI